MSSFVLINIPRLRLWWHKSAVFPWLKTESAAALWSDEARRRDSITKLGDTKIFDPSSSRPVSCHRYLHLRLPILIFPSWNRYGPAPKNSDSAVNILIDVVQDQSGKTYKMDHYATRYPTNVLDIADFLLRLSCTSPYPLVCGSLMFYLQLHRCHVRFPRFCITRAMNLSPNMKCALFLQKYWVWRTNTLSLMLSLPRELERRLVPETVIWIVEKLTPWVWTAVWVFHYSKIGGRRSSWRGNKLNVCTCAPLPWKFYNHFFC